MASIGSKKIAVNSVARANPKAVEKRINFFRVGCWVNSQNRYEVSRIKKVMRMFCRTVAE
tara:strand:+ start:348 stop:527 length:180 start_codon:yes stop_codon:yes gene_type:complete